MEIWSIVKIALLTVGALVVIDHAPGVDILGDGKADYKALVKCEARHEGLKRECRGDREELKRLRKENRRLEKEKKKLKKAFDDEKRDYQGCVAELDRVLSDRASGRGRDRGRLRGDDGGERRKGWKRIFQGR